MLKGNCQEETKTHIITAFLFNLIRQRAATSVASTAAKTTPKSGKTHFTDFVVVTLSNVTSYRSSEVAITEVGLHMPL